MNFDFDIVMILALFTIGSALVYGIASWMRANKAQANHEDAAVAQRQREEDPVTDADAPDEGFTDANGSGRTWTKERGANPPTPTPPRN